MRLDPLGLAAMSMMRETAPAVANRGYRDDPPLSKHIPSVADGLFIFTADGHVSISLMRNPPDQPRTFKIEGDTLTILESYEANGRRVRAERVLRREAAAR